MQLTIVGELATDPELSFPATGTPRLTLIVLADPECPSILWPSPEETVLVVATGPGVERLVGQFRAGDRVRVRGHSQTGVVVNATAIRPLDPLPDTPVIPAAPAVLLRVTRPGAPSLN